MNKEELLEYVSDQAFSGRSYDDIKKEIDTSFQLSEEDRKKVLAATDKAIVHYKLSQQVRNNGIAQMIMGGILIAFGLAVTYLTYSPQNKSYYLWFGAILGGAWFLKEGYKKYTTPIDPPEIKLDRRSRLGRF